MHMMLTILMLLTPHLTTPRASPDQMMFSIMMSSPQYKGYFTLLSLSETSAELKYVVTVTTTFRLDAHQVTDIVMDQRRPHSQLQSGHSGVKLMVTSPGNLHRTALSKLSTPIITKKKMFFLRMFSR